MRSIAAEAQLRFDGIGSHIMSGGDRNKSRRGAEYQKTGLDGARVAKEIFADDLEPALQLLPCRDNLIDQTIYSLMVLYCHPFASQDDVFKFLRRNAHPALAHVLKPTGFRMSLSDPVINITGGELIEVEIPGSTDTAQVRVFSEDCAPKLAFDKIMYSDLPSKYVDQLKIVAENIQKVEESLSELSEWPIWPSGTENLREMLIRAEDALNLELARITSDRNDTRLRAFIDGLIEVWAWTGGRIGGGTGNKDLGYAPGRLPRFIMYLAEIVMTDCPSADAVRGWIKSYKKRRIALAG